MNSTGMMQQPADDGFLDGGALSGGFGHLLSTSLFNELRARVHQLELLLLLLVLLLLFASGSHRIGRALATAAASVGCVGSSQNPPELTLLLMPPTDEPAPERWPDSMPSAPPLPHALVELKYSKLLPPRVCHTAAPPAAPPSRALARFLTGCRRRTAENTGPRLLLTATAPGSCPARQRRGRHHAHHTLSRDQLIHALRDDVILLLGWQQMPTVSALQFLHQKVLLAYVVQCWRADVRASTTSCGNTGATNALTGM
uniref:Uncharacterized protein n=1 Tax=Anopheles atroparvus TaxID=41427 RepID=A0A182JG37_ANOAO